MAGTSPAMTMGLNGAATKKAGEANPHRAQIFTTPGAPHIAQGEKLKR